MNSSVTTLGMLRGCCGGLVSSQTHLQVSRGTCFSSVLSILGDREKRRRNGDLCHLSHRVLGSQKDSSALKSPLFIACSGISMCPLG